MLSNGPKNTTEHQRLLFPEAAPSQALSEASIARSVRASSIGALGELRKEGLDDQSYGEHLIALASMRFGFTRLAIEAKNSWRKLDKRSGSASDTATLAARELILEQRDDLVRRTRKVLPEIEAGQPGYERVNKAEELLNTLSETTRTEKNIDAKLSKVISSLDDVIRGLESIYTGRTDDRRTEFEQQILGERRELYHAWTTFTKACERFDQSKLAAFATDHSIKETVTLAPFTTFRDAIVSAKHELEIDPCNRTIGAVDVAFRLYGLRVALEDLRSETHARPEHVLERDGVSRQRTQIENRAEGLMELVTGARWRNALDENYKTAIDGTLEAIKPIVSHVRRGCPGVSVTDAVEFCVELRDLIDAVDVEAIAKRITK